MELTREENIAFNMLRTNPEEIQKVAKNGNLDLRDLHSYFNKLSFSMDLNERIKKNDFIEVEAKLIPQ